MIFLAAASLPAFSAAECRRAVTQSEMTICSRQDFERADALLNRHWRKAIATAKACDTSAECGRSSQDQRSEEEILRKGQRAWLQFRDAQCEYEGLNVRGGSMEPMIVNQCLARLTRERIKELSSGEK